MAIEASGCLKLDGWPWVAEYPPLFCLLHSQELPWSCSDYLTYRVVRPFQDGRQKNSLCTECVCRQCECGPLSFTWAQLSPDPQGLWALWAMHILLLAPHASCRYQAKSQAKRKMSFRFLFTKTVEEFLCHKELRSQRSKDKYIKYIK